MDNIYKAMEKIKELGGSSESGINWVLGSMPYDIKKMQELIQYLRDNGLEFRTPCKCGDKYRINFREG